MSFSEALFLQDLVIKQPLQLHTASLLLAEVRAQSFTMRFWPLAAQLGTFYGALQL